MADNQKCNHPFIPAAWWNDQLTSQWRARPALAKTISENARIRGRFEGPARKSEGLGHRDSGPDGRLTLRHG